MKKVITYGTFDLFHQGHLNILRRARELGDYLIVGVTSEQYDRQRGKLNVVNSLVERIENVRDTGLVDEIIVEEYLGQKLHDILAHDVDAFAIGSDWAGKFDYLRDHCEVVYLERTQGISSTQLRSESQPIVRLGISGTGRIARRFIRELHFVSGIEAVAVHSPRAESVEDFTRELPAGQGHTDFGVLLEEVDAVYVASPHQFHVEQARQALEAGKHVLCEKPMAFTETDARGLFELAQERGLVLMEAVKTAFSPGFTRLVGLVDSGVIGSVHSVDATFTKISPLQSREMRPDGFGGSAHELGTYPLLAIARLMGTRGEISGVNVVRNAAGVDIYTRVHFTQGERFGTATVGLGVKSEGSLVVSGTDGCVYVPAPWWKTEYFEIHHEDSSRNQKYFHKFEEDGLRYEISAFLNAIRGHAAAASAHLTAADSIWFASVLEQLDRDHLKAARA